MSVSTRKMIVVLMSFGQDTPRILIPPFYVQNRELFAQVREGGWKGTLEEIPKTLIFSWSKRSTLSMRSSETSWTWISCELEGIGHFWPLFII